MDWDTILSVLSGLALVAGLAAAFIAFYKTNLGNAIIKHQSELIDTLTDKVDFLSTELSTHRNQVEQLKQKNSYLEGIVTGKDTLTSLLTEVQGLRRDVSNLEALLITSAGSSNS